ncbi:MAG: T9SS type A sorting domain-containing protein [Ignavibacteriaceae bacterium]|nr:T9SS type A sorting domain-containing protein [Ignavibacteriaceae bacterium]
MMRKSCPNCNLSFLACLLVFFSFEGLFAQNWSWKNPQAGSNIIYDIEHVTGNIWIQGGEMGTIFRTSDDGITWHQVYNPMGNRDVKDIFVVNESILFAFGSGSSETVYTRIVKSTDAGLTWSTVSSSNEAFEKIWCFNESTILGLVSGGALKRSTDGGRTFSDLIYFGVQDHFPNFYFVNDSIGYAVSLSGYLSKSTNGGQSWAATNTNMNAGYYSLFFTDVNNGYLGSNFGRIIKTTDGGVTFTDYNTGTYADFQDIEFISDLVGYGTGLFGNTWRTTNAGGTWELEFSSQSQFYDFYSVSAKSAGVAMVAGNYGNILKRNNTPEWGSSNYVDENSLTSMDWATSQKGYATVWGGYLLSTSDGGESWFRRDLIPGIYIARVVFANENNGFIFTWSDTLFYTTNGGTTWSKALQPQGTFSIQAVHFPTSEIGYAVGYNGEILKTTNSGFSWVSNPLPAGVNLYDVFFTTPETGFISSPWGGTYKTTNGGTSWNLIPGLEGVGLSLDFPSALVGYSIGAGGYSFKTTDGGDTWFPISFPSPSINCYALKFTSETEGYAAGSFGMILRTVDGGVTWYQERSGTGAADRTFWDLDVDPDGELWAVSAFAGVHKKRPGVGVPNTVNLLSPGNSTPALPLIIFFNWTTVPDVEQYQLQYSTSADFSENVTEVLIVSPYHQMLSEELDFYTTYYWRVRAVNSTGPGDFTPVWSFTTYYPNIVLGDVDLNTSVQAYDAGLLLRFQAGSSMLNKEQKRNANVTTDTLLTSFDASVILRYTTGAITELPYPGAVLSEAELFTGRFTMMNDTAGYLPVFIRNAENIYSLDAEFEILSQNSRIDSLTKISSNTLSYSKSELQQAKLAMAGAAPFWQNQSGEVMRLYTTLGNTLGEEPHIRIRYRANESVEKIYISGNPSDTGDEGIPLRFALEQNYPNPFNPVTTLRFTLPSEAYTELRIYDILGTEIIKPISSVLPAGAHHYSFDAGKLSSGVYFCELRSGLYRGIVKMMLTK